MPINPLIALQTQTPDLGQTVGNALTNAANINAIRENRQTAGLRKQAALTEADQARLKSMAITAGQIIPTLEANDIEGTRGILTSRRDQFKKLGLDTRDIDQGLVMLDQDPVMLKAVANNAIQMVNMFDKTGKPAGLVEFESMTKGLKPEEQDKARRIALGLDPRAVGSSVITTATTDGLTDKVTNSESRIAGGKAGAAERAELDAQLEKLPSVKAAVTAAQERVKLEVEAEGVAKKNAIALDTYEKAMAGLTSALSETKTGPVEGRLPAVTADQQIAEGAVTAAAPVLKSIFRLSGEGTFTDQDQKLLLDMVPTRKDHPEAIQAKMRNIDAIVRSKLGAGPKPAAQPDANQQQPAEGAQKVGRFTVTVRK